MLTLYSFVEITSPNSNYLFLIIFDVLTKLKSRCLHSGISKYVERQKKLLRQKAIFFIYKKINM